MFPLNEQRILRILKVYFDYIKNNDAIFEQILQSMFDSDDISPSDIEAFKDVIKNDKLKYALSYTNVTAEFPTIVCLMDLEQQSEKSIGDYLGSEDQDADGYEEADLVGYIGYGIYSINVYTKQIFLTRLLSIFVKMILEHYYTTSAAKDSNFYELEVQLDRFAPDAEYFPANVFHVHIIVRFRYIENFTLFYSLIESIDVSACFGNFVVDSVAFSISTETLADATVGTASSQTLQAVGGSGTYVWSLVSGALPTGLNLSSAGVISGTPLALLEQDRNVYYFTVQATGGGTVTKELSIEILE